MKRIKPESRRGNIEEFIFSLYHGFKPKIIDLSISGRITPSLRRRLTIQINNIISRCTLCKIGATGDADIRSAFNDYRAQFSKMYLIYKSTSKNNVASLEVEYIQKFYGRTLNKSTTKTTRLSSYDGFYYLYIVTD